MVATLAQHNANRPQLKKDGETPINQVYQLSGKPDLFSGHVKHHEVLDVHDEDAKGIDLREKLPDDVKLPQFVFEQELQTLVPAVAAHLNSELTQDTSNAQAEADVKIGDTLIAEKVQLDALITWKQKLDELHNMVNSIPVLSPGLDWKWDRQRGCWRTPETERRHTRKIPHVIHVNKPTEHQPGQYEIRDIDKRVGTWHDSGLSGAMPREQKRAILGRIRQAQEAVNASLATCNHMHVIKKQGAENLLKFIFAGLGEHTEEG